MAALHYGEDRTGQGMIDGIPNWFTIQVVILAWLAAAAAMCWVLMELGILPYDQPPDEGNGSEAVKKLASGIMGRTKSSQSSGKQGLILRPLPGVGIFSHLLSDGGSEVDGVRPSPLLLITILVIVVRQVESSLH